MLYSSTSSKSERPSWMPTEGAEGAATYVVAGRSATKYEYNVAKALEEFGYEYIFQVDLFGGKTVAGGIVLDFLVLTVPLPTPLAVNGDYWHRDPEKEFLQMSLLSGISGFAEPVILWGVDTDTLDAARASIRRYFG